MKKCCVVILFPIEKTKKRKKARKTKVDIHRQKEKAVLRLVVELASE